MAYSADRKPGELTALTTLAADDVFIVGDTTDASEVAKHITKANLITDLSTSLGGINRSVVVTSGDVTAGSTAKTDYIYIIAGAHTISLPAASGNTNRYTFKNNHSANVTVDTAGVETIDGAASISLAPEESVGIMSDGTNFNII
jgi:hypothetical protein